MRDLLAVQLRVWGMNGERLLNAARKQGIPLRGVIRERDRGITLRCPLRFVQAFRELAAMGYLEAIEGFGGRYHRISRKGLEQLLPEFRQEPFIWGPGAV